MILKLAFLQRNVVTIGVGNTAELSTTRFAVKENLRIVYRCFKFCVI